MERKEAIAAGLSKYETGRPCRKGHIAARYTLSAACSDCIADAGNAARGYLTNATIEARNELATSNLVERERFMSGTTQVRVFANKLDVDDLLATASALCALEFPDAPKAKPDVVKPVMGGFQLDVRVPVADVSVIKALAMAKISERAAGNDYSYLHRGATWLKEAERIKPGEAPAPLIPIKAK